MGHLFFSLKLYISLFPLTTAKWYLVCIMTTGFCLPCLCCVPYALITRTNYSIVPRRGPTR